MGKRADNVRDFIEGFCTLKDGSPFIVQSWQMDFLRGLYPDKPGAPRTVTRGCLSTGRKNGKTTFISALKLCHVVGPEASPGGRVRSVATTLRQAAFSFKHMRRMVLASEHLKKRIEIRNSSHSLWCMKNGVGYEAVGSIASASQGDEPDFWVYDELAQAGNLDLYDALDRGQGSVQGEGLGVVMSTYSDDPGNPLAEIIEMVRNGQKAGGMKHWRLDLYTSDPEADPYDWDTIKQANPNLGVSLSIPSVEKEIEEAKANAGKRIKYRAYRLNQNTGSETSLCDPMVWKKCEIKTPQAEMLRDLEGEYVRLGLDLSDKKDLTSLAYWFDDHNYLASDNWLPGDTIAEREMEDRVPYREWRDMGYIEAIPGKVIRHEVILRRLREVSKRYKVTSFRYDRYRMAPLLADLEQESVSLNDVEFGMGYRSMSPAIEFFEEKLLSGELQHSGNPVLSMAIYNCKVEVNPTSIQAERRPAKGARKQNRIDPVVAALASMAPLGEKPPVTASRLINPDLAKKGLEHFLRKKAGEGDAG